MSQHPQPYVGLIVNGTRVAPSTLAWFESIGLQQTCDLKAQELRLQALYTTRGDTVDVTGEIADTSGRDRYA